jgi:hypothetical protein
MTGVPTSAQAERQIDVVEAIQGFASTCVIDANENPSLYDPSYHDAVARVHAAATRVASLENAMADSERCKVVFAVRDEKDLKEVGAAALQTYALGLILNPKSHGEDIALLLLGAACADELAEPSTSS